MWESISSAATLGQFVVVLAATLFAVRQLRQLHRQNELQASLPYLAASRTEEWRRAVMAIDALAANGRADRPFDLQQWRDDESASLRWIGNF